MTKTAVRSDDGDREPLGPMDTLEPMGGLELILEGIDWDDVDKALHSAELAVIRPNAAERLAAVARGVRRGFYEAQLRLKNGPNFSFASFGRRGKEGAIALVDEVSQMGAADYMRQQDRELHTVSYRLPLLAALALEQERTTDFMIGDIVDTVQEITLARTTDPRDDEGDVERVEALLPPGARGVIKHIWLGVQRGVVLAHATNPDVTFNVDPTQIRMADPGPHREAGPLDGTYLLGNDIWHRVPELSFR